MADCLRAVAIGTGLLLAPDALAAAPVAPAAAAASTPLRVDAMRRAQRMLLERAKQRFEAGREAGEGTRTHLEGALDALGLAYALSPESWLLFNMAQVQSRLGACPEAAELYRRFLASEPAPEAKASAEQALELLGGCDGSLEPSSGDSLAPGLLMASALDSIFVAQGTPGSRPLPAPVGVDAAEPDGLARVLPWAFGSLALISGVAGLVYWNEAQAAKQDLDSFRVAGPWVAETQERGESAQDLARVFGGCAIGFALAAGVSYFWLGSERDETPVATALGGLSWFPLQGGAGAGYRSEF
jgi:hypothetical protein